MADDSPEAAFMKAQQEQMDAMAQGYGPQDGTGVGTGNETDSDDYDPSAIMQEDYSIPFDVQKDNTAPSNISSSSVPVGDASLAASKADISTPVPQDSQVPSRTASRQSAPASSTPVPSQNQSRTKGGFVVESDDEDGPEDQKEDSVDPYEPTDLAGPATAVQDNQLATASYTSPESAQIPSQTLTNGAANHLTVPAASTPVSSASQNSPAISHAPGAADSKVSTPVSALPKTRLPNDVIGILEDRIKEDPRGDMDAWLRLIQEHRDRNRQAEARAAYERFFKVFPSAAEKWTEEANWESANNNLYYVEQVFQKSLLSVPHVDLWSTYLQYVRRRNNVLTDPDGRAYKIVAESFDFALKNVGMDKDSGPIWQEYIDFLKSGPGTVGGSGWQDTQKMDSLRAAYQRAICVPTSALNGLWKEYEGFEMGLSKINGRKFMQEKAPSYMTARSSYTQLQNLTRNLNRTTLPRLPPAPGCDGESEYMRQVELWRGWINWEKEDPLVLKDDEPQNYKSRILYLHRQALMALRFWPEMWYDAADWCFQVGMDQEGEKFLEQGTDANPESCLLAFRRADRFEQTTTSDEIQDPGAKLRMEKVRAPYNKVLDALYELYSRTRAKEAQEVASIQANTANGALKQSDDYRPYGEDDDGPDNPTSSAAETEIEKVKKSYAAQLEILSKTLSHAWIALMRAARRVQSKAGFRAIFADARKRGKVTSELYVETALIEYHCYKDPAGTRIFERGMKLFPEDEHFALEYLKHLIAINDITNARAVFETTIGKLTANPATINRAKPIFLFLHEYESHFGELSQVVKLEKRMKELYPEGPGLQFFSERFTSRAFDPTHARPIISSTQSKAPQRPLPSIEEPAPAAPSPAARQATQSPKRGLPDDFDEGLNPPRKLARGESPLKGAAGRRLDQQRRNQVAGAPFQLPPPPLPGQLAFLLSIIPNASHYGPGDLRFDPVETVRLLRDIRLPESYAAWQMERNAPPKPQYAPQPMHQAYGPPAGIPPMQYGGQYRY